MKFERTVYLDNKTRHAAKMEFIQNGRAIRRTELVDVHAGLGRVTAEPVYACLSAPFFHASAMDGIAVRAEHTFAAHESRPLTLVIDRDFCFVNTGAPIDDPYDAVIMIEDVNVLDELRVEITEPATPWQHIRAIGENITQGEMLFASGHTLRPVDLGVLLESGISTVSVIQKPTVVVIPTGNELIAANQAASMPKGKIIESNSTVICNMVQEWGGIATAYPVVPDNYEELKEVLLQAVAQADIVIVNAGSSAGSEDYTIHLLRELGTVFTHGVATKPGKPVILGKIKDTMVVGLPGYPVSSYLTAEWYIYPLICQYLDVAEKQRPKLRVKLGRRVVSPMGTEEFVRMNIGYVNGEFVANPLPRAASATMSLVRADGMLIVPMETLGYEQGDFVEVELYKPVEKIKASILFTGSHDLTIDLLSNHMKRSGSAGEIIAAHVGSLAGIMALRKGETHFTGIHLLDPDTGEYNMPYLRKYGHGADLVLIPFLKRTQGLLVAKGNPLQIATIEDIVTKDIQYVNRQKGAGTRILFDSLLAKANLSPHSVRGYERELYTHLSVAAEVANQPNSTGLAIYPVSQAMNLDFIPIADEDYDLVMTRSFFESEEGQALFTEIQSEAFICDVENVGGYAIVRHPEPIFLEESR